MVSEQKLYKKFEKLKHYARASIDKNAYDLAVDCMKTACALAKNYYLCYEDDTLEDMVAELAESQIKVGHIKTTDRIVFYDTHTTDNIALTQQYLGALISWNIPFMYITTKSLKNRSAALIRGQMESVNNVTVCEIPVSMVDIQKAQFICDRVTEYAPSHALIQTTSDDVAGVMAWAALKETQRFYIDLSDHSFWLGAKIFDYFITFRNCGYNICLDKRNICGDKVFIQPFYPTTISKPFQGFPTGSEKRVKLLSGGRLEKIYGRGEAYFRMVKKILDENKNVSFYFVGGGAFGKLGQTSYVKKMIKKYQLGERFYVLGFRNDIIELFHKVDVYIGTYPIGCGLMTQIAASNNLPVVQYASPGLSDKLSEFLLPEEGDCDQIVYLDEKLFLAQVKEYVEDENERKRSGIRLSQRVMPKAVFDVQLHEIVYALKSEHTVKRYEYDCDKLRKNQIEIENHCSHSYARILIKNKYIRKKEPFLYIGYLAQFAWHSDKKWLLKKVIGK